MTLIPVIDHLMLLHHRIQIFKKIKITVLNLKGVLNRFFKEYGLLKILN